MSPLLALSGHATRVTMSAFGGILLQKYFDHPSAKHWFKIERDQETLIQKRTRPDSIVLISNSTASARRLLQHNRGQSGRHFLTGRVAPEWLYFFHHGASAAKSSPESLGHRSAVHAPICRRDADDVHPIGGR